MPELIDPTRYWPYFFSALRVPAILFGAYLLSRAIKAVVARLHGEIIHRLRGFNLADHEMEKRARAIGSILFKGTVVVIWVVAVMMALKELGFDIAPILAGAGILGLAVGFGAQNMVRDVISGLFLIIENQIRVGDVAVINGASGLVEEVNLRTTVLRGIDGTVHVFPNGAISNLANMTRDYSYYVFSLGVGYREDTDRVMEALREVAAALTQEPDWTPLIKAPLEVMGVDELGDSAVIVKARIKTEPSKQWQVGREMNRRIKKRFEELAIDLPSPHRSLSLAEPPKVAAAGMSREEVRLDHPGRHRRAAGRRSGGRRRGQALGLDRGDRTAWPCCSPGGPRREPARPTAGSALFPDGRGGRLEAVELLVGHVAEGRLGHARRVDDARLGQAGAVAPASGPCLARAPALHGLRPQCSGSPDALAWGMGLAVLDAEEAHVVNELLGLGVQFLGGGGHLLGGRGVLLDHLVELLDGLGDLLHAPGLLVGGGVDLLHQLGGLLDAGHDARRTSLPARSATSTLLADSR